MVCQFNTINDELKGIRVAIGFADESFNKHTLESVVGRNGENLNAGN